MSDTVTFTNAAARKIVTATRTTNGTPVDGTFRDVGRRLTPRQPIDLIIDGPVENAAGKYYATEFVPPDPPDEGTTDTLNTTDDLTTDAIGRRSTSGVAYIFCFMAEAFTSGASANKHVLDGGTLAWGYVLRPVTCDDGVSRVFVRGWADRVGPCNPSFDDTDPDI